MPAPCVQLALAAHRSAMFKRYCCESAITHTVPLITPVKEKRGEILKVPPPLLKNICSFSRFQVLLKRRIVQKSSTIIHPLPPLTGVVL